MPLQVPVFKRETMNHMYGPNVYLATRLISNLIMMLCYPLLLTLIVYFGLGINKDAENFFLYLLTSALLCMLSVALGYLGGVLFDI